MDRMILAYLSVGILPAIFGEGSRFAVKYGTLDIWYVAYLFAHHY